MFAPRMWTCTTRRVCLRQMDRCWGAMRRSISFPGASMCAVENRRWLLRDTNTGVTAAIDPYGRMTQSAPRHEFTSLAVHYGFNDDLTFYTRFGDVFALVCGILSTATLARAVRLTID